MVPPTEVAPDHMIGARSMRYHDAAPIYYIAGREGEVLTAAEIENNLP
jgi:hypothetical protein